MDYTYPPDDQSANIRTQVLLVPTGDIANLVKDETKHFIYASLCALFACLTATVPALVVSAKLDPHIEGLALFVRDRVDLSQTSLVQALFHNARERIESLAGVSSGLSAQASLPTLSISRSGGGAGSVFGPGIFCGSDCTERYISGTAVLLSAVPQTGSFFSGWQGACTGIGTCSVSMTTNRFVTATFGLSPATTAPRTASTTIEAESGTLFDLMATEIDSSARNYRYITSYTANYGTAVFSPYLEKGTYYVWARVLSSDSSKDSFYVSFNGANEDTFDTAEGTWSTKWQWSRVNGRGSRNIPLAINPRPFVVTSPGTQRFTFRAKEAQTKLDAIFITTDQTALPPGYAIATSSVPGFATTTSSNGIVYTYVVGVEGQGRVLSSPTGITCGMGSLDCSEVYLLQDCNAGAECPTPTKVTLTASSSPGWYFVGWQGGCTGRNTCTLSRSQNVVVNASFAAIPPERVYTYAVNVVGKGTVTSTPAGISCTANSGDCIETLSAPACTVASCPNPGKFLMGAKPDPNWYLFSWEGGGCSGGGTRTCELSKAEDLMITATFKEPGRHMEAEAASLAAPIVTAKETNAWGGSYVESKTADFGTAVFSPYLEKGTYYVWARVLSPDSSKDSFYVSFNGANEDTFDTAEGTWSTKWQWSRVNGRGSRNIPLAINPRPFVVTSPGTQRFTFRAKEAQTKLDAIFITTDQTALPEIGATLTSVSIDENATNTISSVTVSNITDRSATVKWTTKKPSSSQVEYGTTAKYGSITDFDYNRVLAHEVVLNNLRPETTYWYKVISTDNLNKSVSSAGKSFKTKATSTVQAAPPTPPPSPSPGAMRVPRGTIFATTLKPGMEHSDVRYMQMLLNDLGFTITQSGPGSKGQETMYFGEATKRALILFQERYAAEVLIPAGLTSGTGTFGPLTRGKFTALVAR